MEKSDEEVQVQPANGLEMGLALAELLASSGKKGQAREMYKTLAQSYPDDPAIPSELGYLALANYKFEEAKQHFAEAVRLNTTNAKLCYDYALLLREGGAPNREVIPLFERALQLNYALDDARLYLGYLRLDEGEFDKALYALIQVKHVTREQAVSLYRAITYAHLRMENEDKAAKALELAKKYAESPEEKASLEPLESFLNRKSGDDRQAAFSAYKPDLDEGPPRLSPGKPDAADAEPGEPQTRAAAASTVSMTGTLEQVECLQSRARLKIAVHGEVKTLAIVDSNEVLVLGADAGSFEFTCGPQKSRPIVVEYEPKEDAEMGTLGEVRTIRLE